MRRTKQQLDIFERDPQYDLFQKRHVQPGLELWADTLKGAADKLTKEAKAVEAAHKAEAKKAPPAPASASGPFAVIYGTRPTLLRSKPNPWHYPPVLRAELDRCAAHTWDDGYKTIEDAERGVAAAKSQLGGAAKYVRIYDQTTGAVAGQKPKAPARARVKLPAFTGAERWEKNLGNGEIAWCDVLPDAENSRIRIVRNDVGEIYREWGSENDERRARMLADGFMVAKSSARPARPAATSHGLGGDSLEETILDAARRLEPRRFGPVGLAALREQVGIPRSDMDRALIDLHTKGRIVLSRNDNTPTVTPQDEVAAVWVGGNPRHLLYLNG